MYWFLALSMALVAFVSADANASAPTLLRCSFLIAGCG